MSPDDTRVVTRAVGDDGAAAAVRPDPLPPQGIPPGTLLVNTYEVERLLGGGGMGEVYLARHARLGTRHAIKVIRPAMARDRQVMDLFYREARVLRGVRHDAVVSYDGFVGDDQGRDYLVMEYAEGPSLADRMRRGPLSPTEVLALRDRLAAGLGEAHRRGAVHRDISPDNVILPGDQIEAAKLIDFGICKLTDPAQETIIGSSFAGKYRYASPEQLGLFGGEVDARSDIYSLGLILAAAAQGRPLDMGDSIEAALRGRQSVPDLSGVPPGLRDWLGAMLQPDPSRRPATMEALLGRWPAEVGQGPQRSRGRVSRETGTPSGGGRRRWTWALGLVVIAGAGAGLYWLLRPLPLEPQPQQVPQPQPQPQHQPQPQPQPQDAPGDLRELMRTGRLDDAFALAQQSVTAGSPPPPQDLWALAQGLRKERRLDQAFALMRELANAGHGPAAFGLAEMYDPLHWSKDSSPFSKPNGSKARDWYRRAAEAGEQGADARIEALGRAEEAP